MFVPQATDNSEILQYIHTPLSIIIRFDSGVTLCTIRTNPIKFRFTVILRCIVNLTHTVRVYIIRNETPTYGAPSSHSVSRTLWGPIPTQIKSRRTPRGLTLVLCTLILCHFSFRVSNYMICRNKVDYTFLICLPVHFLPVIQV